MGLNNYDYTFNKTDPPIQMSPSIKRIYSEDEKRIENSVKHSINYSDSKSPYYVSKASILQLWFLHDGQIKNIVAVDTYTDSAGTSNIFDPTIMTFEDWFKSMTNWVRNIKDWFMKYWKYILIAIVGIGVLPILISLFATIPGLFTGVVKVFKFLVKGIWFIVSTPFKLIKWLFTPKNKTKTKGWN